jgi:hypothetical protein
MAVKGEFVEQMRGRRGGVMLVGGVGVGRGKEAAVV